MLKISKTAILYFYYYVSDLNGSFSFHYHIFLFVSKILPKSFTAILILRLVLLRPSSAEEKLCSLLLSLGPGKE